jgi:hypothetical protein
MAIQNRDLDPTVARYTFQSTLNSCVNGASTGLTAPGLATGLTFPLCTISTQSQLIAAEEAVWGLSGAPQHSLWLYRFVPGAGFTTMVLGTTLAPTAFGTSGALGFSLIGGSSWLLLPGDQIFLKTDVANTAVAQATITLVTKALQDIKADFGV